MNEILFFLTNNYYKVLETIYDNSVTIDGITYCPLTQIELSKIVGVSRNTMIPTIKTLCDKGLLVCVNNSKKYMLSDCAYNLIKKMKKL